jgi:elongator complex protein 3
MKRVENNHRSQAEQEWLRAQELTPEKKQLAEKVLDAIRSGIDPFKAIRRHPLSGGGYLAKSLLVSAYNSLVESGKWQEDAGLLARIRMKPVRTLSGVTTVTVLTKPYPCPGKCIFCPNEASMPKSYLADEPGAMRGVQNQFDPYLQVSTRLQSLEAVGHPTDKIELLILGGTWSAYKRDYQEWFVRRCFDALNGGEAASLEEAHRLNESAAHRNVGLVVETRPDEIDLAEIAWLRRLGATKVQLGAQSLDDAILARSLRGHTSADTLQATALLRAAGFKIVLHWMPNLLGASLESDREDFARLWAPVDGGGGYAPDEIKIYPTQLLKSADLYQFWLRGEYRPYEMQELIHLIADIKPHIPPYCRVNRVIRDIPSPHVVAGNRRTSLRQDVLTELERRGQACGCIRCREVRGQKIVRESLRLEDYIYYPAHAEEHFLQFLTPEDRIAGYLRLSLPTARAPQTALSLPDLANAALIREVHVYGQSLPVGQGQIGAAQHQGLGTSLLDRACEIALERGFPRLAVISAVGTRLYYEKRGFERGELYLVKQIL